MGRIFGYVRERLVAAELLAGLVELLAETAFALVFGF